MIAVCAALGWEVRPLLRAFGPMRRLGGRHPVAWVTRGDPRVLVFQTGVGIAAAERATASVLVDYPVTAVINSGSAGALLPGIEVGSVVVATAVLRRCLPATGERGFLREPTEVRLVDRLAEAARKRGFDPVLGEILSSPVPLATARAKRLAREEVGAAAVEMEGAGVAAASREHGVGFSSVRVILDRADEDLEPALGGAALLRTLAKAVRRDGIPSSFAALRLAMQKTESTMEALFTSVRAAAGSEGWFDDGP